MLLALFDWWGDAALGLPRAQVVTGVLGVVLALAAIFYAWRIAQRQFKMGEDQAKVIDRQLDLLNQHKGLLTRIEQIEGDQRAILKRQGEIAETQYRIMQEELARRPAPVVELNERQLVPGPQTFNVQVINKGSASMPEWYWHFLIPESVLEHLTFEPLGADVSQQPSKISDVSYRQFIGLSKMPLFPNRGVTILTFSVSTSIPRDHDFMFLWWVDTEFGRFPLEEALGSLTAKANRKP